jgi:hypothetical protein
MLGARGIPGGGNWLKHLSFLAEKALQSRVESGNLQA